LEHYSEYCIIVQFHHAFSILIIAPWHGPLPLPGSLAERLQV
jgi:hypothetical protein